jgi:hypothetical protein
VVEEVRDLNFHRQLERERPVTTKRTTKQILLSTALPGYSSSTINMVRWLRQAAAWLATFLPNPTPEVDPYVEPHNVWNQDIGPVDVTHVFETADKPCTEGHNIYNTTIGVMASPDYLRNFCDENDLPEETGSSSSGSFSADNTNASSGSDSFPGSDSGSVDDDTHSSNTSYQGSPTDECTKCRCHCPGYKKVSPEGLASEASDLTGVDVDITPSANNDSNVPNRDSVDSPGEVINVYLDTRHPTTTTFPTANADHPEPLLSSTPKSSPASKAKRKRPSPLNTTAINAHYAASTHTTTTTTRRPDTPAPWQQRFVSSCGIESLLPPNTNPSPDPNRNPNSSRPTHRHKPAPTPESAPEPTHAPAPEPAPKPSSAPAAEPTPPTPHQSPPPFDLTRPENNLASTIRRRNAREKKEREFEERERARMRYEWGERNGYWYWRDAGL